MIETVQTWLRDWSYGIKHTLFRNFWLFTPIVITIGLLWLVNPDWPVDWKGGFEWR